MPKNIYHITSHDAVDRAMQSGVYIPANFDTDGYIHCSYFHQVAEVAHRFYQDATDLVILEIDPAKIACRVVDENLEGGIELFPHLYGVLPVDAVVEVHKFHYESEGQWVLPMVFMKRWTKSNNIGDQK